MYIRNGVKRKCLKKSPRLYDDSYKENPLTQIAADVLKFKLTLSFKTKRKKEKTLLQSCCKVMQLEIGGLATKARFAHCLQPVV